MDLGLLPNLSFPPQSLSIKIRRLEEFVTYQINVAPTLKLRKEGSHFKVKLKKMNHKNCGSISVPENWRQFNFQIELKFEMLIFDERENWRRKTKNNNFNLNPQLASMARLKFIDQATLAGGECFLPLRHPKIARSPEFPQLVSCFRSLTRVRQLPTEVFKPHSCQTH